MTTVDDFKLIVAGSRDFNDYEKLSQVLNEFSDSDFTDKPISIVSGMARGADRLGYQFALQHKVKLYKFPADWDQYGKRAGIIRNRQMADFADAAICFWDGKSPGTKHMIDIMMRANKFCWIISY